MGQFYGELFYCSNLVETYELGGNGPDTVNGFLSVEKVKTEGHIFPAKKKLCISQQYYNIPKKIYFLQ